MGKGLVPKRGISPLKMAYFRTLTFLTVLHKGAAGQRNLGELHFTLAHFFG